MSGRAGQKETPVAAGVNQFTATDDIIIGFRGILSPSSEAGTVCRNRTQLLYRQLTLQKLWETFVAVLSEKHLEARQPSLTHFSALHIFKIPIVEVVVCSAWLYFWFAFLLFPPLPCRSLPAAPSLLFSPGDTLEVIITFASGFISIYSHNNTEKERTDITRVMYYPVRESSFIMTSNRASSLRHLFLHLFLSLTHTLSFFTPLSPLFIIAGSMVLPSL